ncbi:MAG: cation:proton antiporter [Pseudomonadota bacterium]
MTHNQIFALFLAVGVLLGVALVLGELARKFRQPAVLGELLAGIILGPTVLGSVAPELSGFLFPLEGPNAIALETISTLGIAFFLMVAGIEVDLSTIWRQGRASFKIGAASVVAPFIFGFALSWLAPRALGRQPGADPLIFSLFLATAVSISALPIIAKTLMDLDLYRTDLGMTVVSAAIFNDLIGWIVFAVVLGLMGPTGGGDILMTILLVFTFTAAMLTLGRWLIHWMMPYVQAYTRWPGGELSFALILALLGASFTEWIGIHAIFGAFIVGVAVGDSSHLRERTRFTIEHFISFFFAPVFFASIGLKVDFLAHFDLPLTTTVLLVTCVFKLTGGVLGARWAGLSGRESWAAGFSMISVGAMGIIIGLLALESGIIRPRLFVALVVMAIVSSMISGPLIRLTLTPKKKWRVQDYASSKRFLRDLKATSRREAIGELCLAAARDSGLDQALLEAAVWEREETQGTGLGNGLAIPHARLDGLSEPLLVVGFSEQGLDFDAPDDLPAKVIILILTPGDEPSAQLELIAGLARRFRNKSMLGYMLRVQNFTDFMALMNTTGSKK